MSAVRVVELSNWVRSGESDIALAFWPLNDGASRHRELLGRMSIGLITGAATIYLRPKAEEARALIEALEWALANPVEADVQP